MDLKQLFDEHEIDFLLISNPMHVRYLTTFPVSLPTEREAWIILTPQSLHLITDARYVEDAQNARTHEKTLKYSHHILSRENTFTKILQSIIASENAKNMSSTQITKTRLGFESENLSFEEYKKLHEKLDVGLIPIVHPLSRFREIKNEVEIEKMQHAGHATVRCFDYIQAWMKPGFTESQIAIEIEKWLFLEGYTCAFPPIVAFDEHAAQIHFNSKAHGSKKLENGTFVLIDMGAMFEAYCSDMSRSFIFGEKPDSPNTNDFEKAYGIVEKAYNAGLDKLRECAQKNLYGIMTYADVDKAVRAVFKQNNLVDFQHATGHGLGLEIHESPRIFGESSDTIQKGHVVTVEPGYYKTGAFGIRIEDTVLLEEYGIKILTK